MQGSVDGPVKGVQCPEDFFPGLNRKSPKAESLLALVKTKTVGKADSHSFVVQKLVVVCNGNTIDLSKHKTLQCSKILFRQDRSNRSLPLSLKACPALLIPLSVHQ